MKVADMLFDLSRHEPNEPIILYDESGLDYVCCVGQNIRDSESSVVVLVERQPKAATWLTVMEMKSKLMRLTTNPELEFREIGNIDKVLQLGRLE